MAILFKSNGFCNGFFHLHFIFYNQPIHLIVCMQNNWKYPWCSPKHINHLVTHQCKYMATCSLWHRIESNFLFFIWISYIFCYYFDFKTFTHIHCTDVGLSRRIQRSCHSIDYKFCYLNYKITVFMCAPVCLCLRLHPIQLETNQLIQSLQSVFPSIKWIDPVT